MSQALRHRLSQELGPRVRFDEPLSSHTTWRVGGPAWALAEVHSAEEASLISRLTREAGLPLKPLGRGSNLLFSDEGFSGVVLKMGGELASIVECKDGLKAGGGAQLAAAVKLAAGIGLSGLEWAVGIPSTLGGAVAGNAGAMGSEMHQLTRRITLLERDGQAKEYDGERFPAGYRMRKLPKESLVLGAKLGLTPDDPARVQRRTKEILAKRQAGQPLNRATCGSVFKNPAGDFAGRLIEACGLKGSSRGGAAVSLRHANFIENTGGARAADIKELMQHIRRVVKQLHGVDLEPEVEEVGHG